SVAPSSACRPSTFDFSEILRRSAPATREGVRTMKRSQSRILTTHVGSLVRPREIVDILQRKEDGHPFTDVERALLARHVAEAVPMQAECGVDVPSDGEYSKTGFSQYITDRLTGFELRPDLPGRGGGTARSRDRKRFPDAYREIEGSSQNA